MGAPQVRHFIVHLRRAGQVSAPPLNRNVRSLVSDRVACSACGAQILATTAAKTGGFCMPCQGNYRQNIEASRKRIQDDKAYRASPEWKYWEALARRVYQDDEGGFFRLSLEEQKYFAARVLVGEVYNGGFHQYFWNSSADYYARAMELLVELGARESLRLLRDAKDVVFGAQPVPKTKAQRSAVLSRLTTERSPDRTAKLDHLDKEFWADPDKLSDRIERYAEANALRKDF
jgi:hypothetical protein